MILLRMLPALAFLVFAGGPAAAEEVSTQRAAELHPQLYAAMYGFAVCEYCGLITYDVYDGFHRETASLIAAEGLSDEMVRKVRIRAWTDADLEYGDRGLGGFRGWCRTEGVAAAQRFTAFHADAIAAEKSGGE